MTPSHALPDVLAPGLSVVFCGTAAGETSASRGAYYAGPGNRFWRTLHVVGLTPMELKPEQFSTLPTFGIGLTDIVKHRAGNDCVLKESDVDVPSFRAKIRQFAPRFIAFNGKKAAAVFFGCSTGDVMFGEQLAREGETRVWVLPSTSGSARGFWTIEHWEKLASACQNPVRR